jgi:glycosyltransferase involved in cell wall biosynthesis
MECLIVDDCGTDDSIAIAERTIATYEGPIVFQVLHHERNRGLSAARNTGTLAAKGNYLYYLDSDDEITEDCMALLMGKAEEWPEAELVQGNYFCHTLTGETVVPIKQYALAVASSNDEVRKCYYRNTVVTAWNKLIRRDFLINHHLFNKEGIIHEDVLWFFYLLKYLNKACFVSTITYHWRQRPHSITTGTDRATEAYHWALVYHDILSNLTPGHEQEEFRFYVKRFCSILLNFFRYDSGMEEVFLLCWDLSRQYGDGRLRFKLAVYRFLGSFKYGWGVVALWKRVITPSMVRRDIKRIWMYREHPY